MGRPFHSITYRVNGPVPLTQQDINWVDLAHTLEDLLIKCVEWLRTDIFLTGDQG